ncbi:hypothetical protein L9F63_021372, partial [Diploptera punctata]
LKSTCLKHFRNLYFPFRCNSYSKHPFEKKIMVQACHHSLALVVVCQKCTPPGDIATVDD